MVESFLNHFAELLKLFKELILVSDPGKRLYWVYIATFLGVSCIVYLKRKKTEEKSLLGYLFPKQVYTNQSTFVDLKIYLINGLVGGILSFSTIVFSAAAVGEITFQLLGLVMGVSSLSWTPTTATIAVFSFLGVVLSDLGKFISHYLHHRVPVLWAIHKVHHSAKVLTPVTAFRFHPFELIVAGVAVALTLGPLVGLYKFLYDTGIFATASFLVGSLLFLWLITANFRHSHIKIHYPEFISKWVVSPAMHNLHHSSEPRHFDKNMGFIFSFWDRLANTYYLPEKDEQYGFGIGQNEDKEYESIWKCYTRPLREIYVMTSMQCKRLLNLKSN